MTGSIHGTRNTVFLIAYCLFSSTLKHSNAQTPLIFPNCCRSVDKRQIISYHHSMKYFNWNTEKNEILKRERGLSFEEIVYLIESGQILSVEDNPTRPDQKIYILEIENYTVVVPFVETGDEIFLKTAFPSRKYSKRFGLKEEI
jgi:uncharacterized DUF497 family protein